MIEDVQADSKRSELMFMVPLQEIYKEFAVNENIIGKSGL